MVCAMPMYATRPPSTFITDADMLALFRKLVGYRTWDKFSQFAFAKAPYSGHDYIEWLFYDPERFCKLVAEFKPWEKFQ